MRVESVRTALGMNVGGILPHNELAFLQEQGIQRKSNEYRLQELFHLVIESKLFLKK